MVFLAIYNPPGPRTFARCARLLIWFADNAWRKEGRMKSGPDDVDDDDDDAIIIIEARTGVAGVACAGLEFAVGDCSGCNSVASVCIYI